MKQIIILALVCICNSLLAQTKPDDITGVWLTAGNEPAKIQIYKQGETYFGKIMWLKNPVENGKPRVDENNPDKNKRSQPVMGLVILKNFKFDEDEWEGGKIYDPESGKTYSCTITLQNKNTLKVRGYIGISLIGRTEYWKRAE